jgi:phosphoglycerate dehydrogenase-like enzyme
MKNTTSQLALITTALTEQWQQRLQQRFPALHFDFRAVKNTTEIPDERWRNVEILYTLGNILPTREQAPQLRWVQLFSAGADRMLTQPLFKTDVIFTTSSGVHSFNIGEYVLTAILNWYHRIPQLQKWQQQSEWPSDQVRSALDPEELRNKTIGIVGYGSIGREVARLAKAFGMRIVALQRGSDHHDHGFIFPGGGDPEGRLPEHYYTNEQFHDLLHISDVVVIAVPLTPQTKLLFNATAFQAMKQDAFLVNIARGEVCDEEALLQALQEKRIAGAALDVFEQEPLPASSPFWQLPNVFISPHITGRTPHYEERAMQIFEANIERYLSDETLYNAVDKSKGY